jgi:histidinol-phosphate/aromatic aminotransferase/cobyric acid decarboxylase-like protein
MNMNIELAAKRLGLLHELLPGARRFAVLLSPNNPTGSATRDALAAAAAAGWHRIVWAVIVKKRT